VHFIEGTLASWTLILLRNLTLSSGLFQMFARLGGALTHTQIQAKSTGMMMLFQMLMVVLASLIASSLFDTLKQILDEPLQLPQLLASALPAQSEFFLNYLNTVTVLLLLFDLLRFMSLCALWFEKICCCVFGCSNFWSNFLDNQNYGDYRLESPYARAVLMMQIAFVFMFIAPLVPVMVLAFMIVAYPVWARLLNEGIERPIVDTAGMLWEQAIVYQGYALLLAQLLLMGVLLKKQCLAGGVIIILLLLFSLYRLLKMRSKWGGAARQMPLRMAVELDASREHSGVKRTLAEELEPYQRGGLHLGASGKKKLPFLSKSQ